MSARPTPLRRELKFLIHHSTRELLLQRWAPYLISAPFTDRASRTPILSLYYDSPTLRFYHEKLAGYGRRTKVRLRTYAPRMGAGRATFLEIKGRHNDYVQKLRYRVGGSTVAHLDPSSWECDDADARSALLELLHRHRLKAAAQVYYQREAYEGVVERDVRVTVDTNVLALHPGEELGPRFRWDRSRSLIPDTLAILEVKSTHGIPPWVHDGIRAFELEQKTIPKYVAAVEALGLPDLRPSGDYA